mgnify:CR=1 FL=1
MKKKQTSIMENICLLSIQCKQNQKEKRNQMSQKSEMVEKSQFYDNSGPIVILNSANESVRTKKK